MQNNLFHFFIYSDSGSCIYKLSSENNFDNSIQGILQALYFTTLDNNFGIKTVSTEYGTLAFKSFKSEDKVLLMALIISDYFGDEELTEIVLDRILDYLYSVLVMHIGLTDLFFFHSPHEIDTLKKLIEIFQPSLKYILTNWMKLNFLLKSERKVEISKEVLYPIKHYVENFKNVLKVDFLCLVVNSAIVWASSDWLALDIVDRLLFVSLTDIYCESDICEIPIYFSKTTLENGSTGKSPFKLFCINILRSNNAKLLILADSSMNIKRISDALNFKIFDEFFLSRLMNFTNVTQLGNLVDTTAKSIVILNNCLKTYKIMIDELYEEVFSNFIQNAHFSSAILKKSSSCEEFYIKDTKFTFYFYKVGVLTFLMLYDKDTTFDDVNNVKITIKTFKEKFDNKENYDETTVETEEKIKSIK